MIVRAKFGCVGKSDTSVTFLPVVGPENEPWSKATPAGQITITITNGDALEKFEPGKPYFVDFTPAD